LSDEDPVRDSADPLEELLERYGALLRGAIAQVCPKNLGLDFDDIEQETRLRLWRAIQAETEIEKPASYLYRVAVTATLDAVRRATARREEQLADPRVAMESVSGPPLQVDGLSPEAQADHRILLRKVGAALSRMTRNKRRAVGLHVRGFSPGEIGRLLGWTEARARSLVYRGLRELRAALAAEGVEYESS